MLDHLQIVDGIFSDHSICMLYLGWYFYWVIGDSRNEGQYDSCLNSILIRVPSCENRRSIARALVGDVYFFDRQRIAVDFVLEKCNREEIFDINNIYIKVNILVEISFGHMLVGGVTNTRSGWVVNDCSKLYLITHDIILFQCFMFQ